RPGVRRPALPDLAAGSPLARRPSPVESRHPGGKTMRHLRILVGVSALALVLSSCGQKTETATSQSASDSLLAASPVEPPQGNLTPTQDMANQQQTPDNTTPPSTPATTRPKSSTPK